MALPAILIITALASKTLGEEIPTTNQPPIRPPIRPPTLDLAGLPVGLHSHVSELLYR